jgi:hypothetical protein
VVQYIWEAIWSLLNTGFGTALIGAFAGAAGANWFASRKETNRQTIMEIRAANAATSLSGALANHALGFKEQVGLLTINQYFGDRDRYIAFLEEAKVGKRPGEAFQIEYAFTNLKHFAHDAPKLTHLVLHEVSADPMTVTIALHLEQTLNSLENVVKQRNLEIERLGKCKGKISDDEFAHLYFGIETGDGRIDERFVNTMEGFRELLDDTIFFSIELNEKTSTLAQNIANKLGKKSPKPTVFDFTQVSAGLLPDRSNYLDFFQKTPN